MPHQKTNTKTLDKNGSFLSRTFHELWPVLIISHPNTKKNGCRNPILSVLYPNYIPLDPRISPHSAPIELLVISIPFIVFLWMGYVFSITIPCRHVFLHIIYIYTYISPITTPYIAGKPPFRWSQRINLQIRRCSHDVNMMFPWCSHGFPMIFSWCSHDFLMMLTWCSHGFPWSSHDVNMMFPWCSHDLPMIFPWC